MVFPKHHRTDSDQLRLFGNPTLEKEDEKPVIDVKTMDDYAFLYTVTAKGNNSGVHFMMSTEDAQKWCASPKSRGVYCGNPWAYFYTTVQNFTTCHWFKNEKVLELRNCCDNGKYDAIIEEMKLKKYSLDEMKTVLNRFGIRVNIKLSKI